MYSGGFANFDSPEDKWGFWCRMIWFTRFVDEQRPVYRTLYNLMRDKNYFVLTTNGDHCFQKAGFDKTRLFYTQGDMGLIQCSKPCHHETYDNEQLIRKMLLSQGYVFTEDDQLTVPAGVRPNMKIASDLVPKCPRCGRPMEMNLRGDDTFVEDAGWNIACTRYEEFLSRYRDSRVLLLVLGVGYNTPGIIKFNFWRMTYHWPNAVYASVNLRDTAVPEEIREKSVCVEGDIGDILKNLYSA